MDSVVPPESPDSPGAKPSFRKPSNDTANRKYRRHSPLGRAGSSSSGGSPKRERSHSPVNSLNDNSMMTGDGRRKDDGKELERESSRHRSSRADDSFRHSDRSAYGNSHDYRRHNDFSRHERHTNEEDRIYQRSSRSGRESRSSSRYDHTRHDNKSDRSRDNWREVDKYTRTNKERDTIVPEHYRHRDRDSERVRVRDSEKSAPGSRQINSNRDDDRTGQREKHTDREARDGRRDRHRSPDYKNGRTSHDLVLGRDSGSLHSKEPHKRSNKEMDGQKDDLVLKRKHDVRETEKHKEKYTDTVITEDHISSAKKLKLGHSEGDEKPSSSSKKVPETAEIAISKPVTSITNQADTASDLDAAKVAAIKAAELVNKNLVGGGYLSTDQKKKLLWGNKKNTVTEESPPVNRWDLQLFSDRERQEKFNKLMGVKGDAVPEHKVDDKDAEKQRELLNMDLEKQYTAGLRRRDGRTVGLGL